MLRHLILAACLATTLPAHADTPRLGGDVILRLGFDGIYEADTSLATSNDTFGIMIASPELHFGNGLILGSEIRFEALQPPTEDRVFEDEGFFLRELFLRYDVTNRLTLQFGKYAPSFALASLVTPGMYGNNYNKEIELIDRIALSAEYTFGAGVFGEQRLIFSTFFEDTSLLSGSIGFERGINRVSDGGASNTETFSSFALTLEGQEIPGFEGLTYKIGFLHQARGSDGVADEQGLAIAALWTSPLGEGRSVSVIGEIAPIWNIDGTKDDVIYTTLALSFQTQPWTFILSGTSRRRDLSGGGSFEDYNLQTSVEYDFGDGLSLALAHEFLRDENRDSRRIGLRLSKQFNLGR